MPLQKQPVAISFAKGLDTKTDKYQVALGQFLALKNSIFTTTGRLTKRNGFSNITKLPVTTQTTITTLNDSLVATGSDLYAFSEDTNQWIDQGKVQPVRLDTLPLLRVSTSQSSPDMAVAASGLICLAYIDNAQAYYQVSDSQTGQQIVKRQILPATATNPRVFILGQYFIITFMATVTGTPTLQYIAIQIVSPSNATPPTTFSSSVASITTGYDGYSIGNILYLAWGGSGTTVHLGFLTNTLGIQPPVTIAGATADLMSVTVDPTTANIWLSYWATGSGNGFTTAYNSILAQIVTPTPIIVGVQIAEITSIASNNFTVVTFQTINNYPYNGMVSGTTIRTDFVSTLTVTAPIGIGTGIVSATTISQRSVGLASKDFIGQYTYTLNSNPTVTVIASILPSLPYTLIGIVVYSILEYGDNTQISAIDNTNQATYFLAGQTILYNAGSPAPSGTANVYMRLAYSNGGGYTRSQVLPNITLLNGSYYLPYLVADFLTTVNKGTNLPAGTPANAIYTQFGINLAKFSINSNGQYSSEIAGALHLTGGQLWEYDGVKPVEHGFHVWPENVSVTTSASGGLITAQQYFYVFTYEWTDNAGQLHRSAPSVPVTITTTGSTSTNTIHVPTLRLTYKLSPNPARIVGYRWSTAQQVYYQFTSITAPAINDTTVDSVTITDTKSDLAILGQTLLYTTGGVIEDIAAPASIASALYANRLFLIDAEDQNLLWFSKQVIEAVPVEMSDLLTLYVAPTTGAQGSTGPMTALSAMDDKLIIFKKDAIYYINGTGPDNTGANSTFSDPVFITATVGCAVPNSIVLMPNGIIFQSDKGIWLLGRDLSTTYIGAGVEEFNSNVVLSAMAIPGTNQVRFVLDDSTTLMYDYFVQQWGTHTNIEAISATLYQGSHTYLNLLGQVFQETPNMYTDGSEPVLMGLTTSWINVAGLQGYERFYFANLLGTYYSPFKLDVLLAYDYNTSPSQNIIVTPNNQAKPWGGESVWGGGGPWGGPTEVFTARIFPDKQKCQSFQVTIQEVYDPSFAQPAGQGLSLSGLALIIGMKKGYRTQSAAKSFG